MVSLYRLQNYWNFDLEWKHGKRKTALRARKVTGTFEELAPGQEPITKRFLGWQNAMISLNFASLETRKTHWAELHLAKTSGTLTRNKEKKLANSWSALTSPVTIPGTTAGHILVPVPFSILKWRKEKLTLASTSFHWLCVLTETLYRKLPLLSFPTYWPLPHLAVKEKRHPIISLPDTPPLWILFIMTFCSLIEKKKKQ